MITSVDIPTENWTRFRIKVMETFPGPNVNRVMQKLVQDFTDGKIKIELETKSYTTEPRSKEKKAPRQRRLSNIYKNKWVALIDGKPVTATSSREETERLTIEGYGNESHALIIFCQ